MDRYMGQLIRTEGAVFECRIDASTTYAREGARPESGVVATLRASTLREIRALIRMHMGF